MSKVMRAVSWVLNLAVLPLVVVYSWLVMSGSRFPAPLIGVLLIVEVGFGTWALMRLSQTPGTKLSTKMWVTRSGLSFAAILPAAVLVWQVWLGGDGPGK